jgi:CO/xanthine dehydrogenase FAD-binding subunit
VGPAGPTPRRVCEVEDVLRGRRYNTQSFNLAEETGRKSLRFRTSARRSSADYRYHLSGGLLEKVMDMAWQRAAVLPVEER